ncbi:hypothetical protein B0T11DRAFT_286555 [Plectosphaerella cucumerina]|uniref:Uncharacterized protein n=1 Tax=Plectosphaerella cucumerina TaxID=40658 RepID=A0A8K0TDA3_9PEZI|nr:hypothetical protein B0T11DRAFT_286555 [Plectosphaerella cucumerina]
MLKTLRLTHRRFTHLRYINRILFTTAEFGATPSCLANLQEGSFGRIAQYVRSIKFLPQPSFGIKKCEFDSVVTEFAGRDLPRGQLDEAWISYRQIVRTSIQWLSDHNSELMRAWIDALRSVNGHLRRVEFATLGCSRHPDILIPTPTTWESSCRIGPHSNCGQRPGNPKLWRTNACLERHTRAADATLAAAVWCMAESGVAVEQLVIKSHLSGERSWETLPGWDRLDLSRLESFVFEPFWDMYLTEGTSDDVGFFEDGGAAVKPLLKRDREANARRLGCALHAVIAKSHRTLRHLHQHPRWFSFENVPHVIWPELVLPAMPKLESLRLMQCSFRQRRALDFFASWVTQMPRLEHIELIDGHACNPDPASSADSAWEPLFGAIRDHPNVANPGAAGVYVDFQMMMARQGDCLSYCRQVRRLRDDEHPDGDFNFDSTWARKLDSLWLGEIVSRPSEGVDFGHEEVKGRDHDWAYSHVKAGRAFKEKHMEKMRIRSRLADEFRLPIY